MGEVTYVWPDARSGRHQAALSSLVRAMVEKQVYGYCRLIGRDNSSPKMCVLRPENVNGVDCFLMVQVSSKSACVYRPALSKPDAIQQRRAQLRL